MESDERVCFACSMKRGICSHYSCKNDVSKFLKALRYDNKKLDAFDMVDFRLSVRDMVVGMMGHEPKWQWCHLHFDHGMKFHKHDMVVEAL